MTRLDQIAAHAQAHDFATEMESATWEDETETDPTVTTSLRPPKSLLNWLRERAIEHFPAATVVGGVHKAGARIDL